MDGADDHNDAGSKGRRERCSREPVLGAADAGADPTARRAAGRVADNEHALVADPDPTLTEIGREISRLGRFGAGAGRTAQRLSPGARRTPMAIRSA
jgi:hypothetical protein